MAAIALLTNLLRTIIAINITPTQFRFQLLGHLHTDASSIQTAKCHIQNKRINEPIIKNALVTDKL